MGTNPSPPIPRYYGPGVRPDGVIAKMLDAAGPAQRGEADPPEPAITDEMVERAAEVIEDECGYALYVHLGSEPFPDAPYWKRIARRALEAALGDDA